MVKRVAAADLKLYNANNRGNRTRDCVKRAISLAFDVPYSEIGKLLNNKMHEKRRTEWNISPVYRPVIDDLGGGNLYKVNDIITVDEFADTHDPSKIYILETGSKPGKISHMLCIRDGKVWDSWDSKEYYVDSYYEIDGSERKPIRQTDKHFMAKLCIDYAQPIVVEEMQRYNDKKNLNAATWSIDSVTSDYKITVRCQLTIDANELISKKRTYKFEIVIVSEPTWTEEEIIEFIKKTAKTRTYDRMYAIEKQESKLKEAAEVSRDANKVVDESDLYLTSQERRFVNTLPGWVIPLIQHVMIEKPGQYSDSYMLRISPLPGDPHSYKSILFRDWSANGIRYMLDRYKEDYSIEGEDYYKDW